VDAGLQALDLAQVLETQSAVVYLKRGEVFLKLGLLVAGGSGELIGREHHKGAEHQDAAGERGENDCAMDHAAAIGPRSD